MLLKQGLAYSLFYIENIQLHPMRKWKLKTVYVISICTVSVLFLLLLLLLFFFCLLELYCLFFHSEHERQVKRQDKFAILEVINYRAFFSSFACWHFLTWYLLERCGAIDQIALSMMCIFFYIPRFINCRSFVTV